MLASKVWSRAPDGIPAEVAELIATTPFDRGGVRHLAALLPESNADLQGWFAAQAEELDEVGFCKLCAAAEMAQRVLPASLLPRMLGLRVECWLLARLGWRMEGDVAEQAPWAAENAR